MNAQTECSAFWRPRISSVMVAVAVAGGITLANLSSEPVTGELIKYVASQPERAYGWPVTWYWRVTSMVPGSVPPWNSLPARPELVWPVSRYSTSGLIVNLAIWLALLAASAAACQRLRQGYQPRLNWRPRVPTLIIAMLVIASILLANMTVELSYVSISPIWFGTASSGWPSAWRWYWVAPFDNVYGWDFSAARLAGNTALWLGMMAAVALPCEWLLRRYQLRLRFSLRAMLAAVAVVAVLCAWCVAVWKRANDQDELHALGLASHDLWVERPGPKWLRLVVPDRYRRRVVGANIYLDSLSLSDEEEQKQHATDNQEAIRDEEGPTSEADEDEPDLDGELTPEELVRQEGEVLKRLGRLPALRYLDINYGVLTPAMSDALAKLDQLRSLHVGLPFLNHPGRTTNLEWVGHLRRLEQLSLEQVASDELSCLANLTHLKSLSLDLTDCKDDESEMDRRVAAVAKLTQLHRLHLQGSPGAQIAHLSGLTNLKSLAIDFHHFDGDEERLRQCFAAIGTLTQVELLRLLTPSGPLRVRADNLASLRGMKCLRSLSLLITCDKGERQACLAALANLTQLRRLWLEGDLVTTGVAQLAPLESLEELLISDGRMETPAAIESLWALKGLKAVHIRGLAFELSTLTGEHVDARRALDSFKRSHPGRVSNLWREWQNDLALMGGAAPHFADEPPDVNSFWQHFDEKPPDLDTFLGGNPAGP